MLWVSKIPIIWNMGLFFLMRKVLVYFSLCQFWYFPFPIGCFNWVQSETVRVPMSTTSFRALKDESMRMVKVFVNLLLFFFSLIRLSIDFNWFLCLFCCCYMRFPHVKFVCTHNLSKDFGFLFIIDSLSDRTKPISLWQNERKKNVYPNPKLERTLWQFKYHLSISKYWTNFFLFSLFNYIKGSNCKQEKLATKPNKNDYQPDKK